MFAMGNAKIPVRPVQSRDQRVIEMEQLGFFAEDGSLGRDAAATRMENAVVDALCRCPGRIGPAGFSAARQALAELAANYPTAQGIGAFRSALRFDGIPTRAASIAELSDWVARAREAQPFVEASPALRDRGWFEKNVWAPLARAAERFDFDRGRPDLHASELWFAAGEWEKALDAIGTIPDALSMPRQLALHIRASYKLTVVLDDIWAHMFELAWIDPSGFRATATAIDDPILCDLVAKFDDANGNSGEDLSDSFFPAYAIATHPALRCRADRIRPLKADSDGYRAYDSVVEWKAYNRDGGSRPGARESIARHTARLVAISPMLAEAARVRD